MHLFLKAWLLLQGVPPLKFAIFFAGALIRDRNLSYIYKEKVALPSLHVIGDKDYVKEVGFVHVGFVHVHVQVGNVHMSPTATFKSVLISMVMMMSTDLKVAEASLRAQ